MTWRSSNALLHLNCAWYFQCLAVKLISCDRTHMCTFITNCTHVLIALCFQEIPWQNSITLCASSSFCAPECLWGRRFDSSTPLSSFMFSKVTLCRQCTSSPKSYSVELSSATVWPGASCASMVVYIHSITEYTLHLSSHYGIPTAPFATSTLRSSPSLVRILLVTVDMVLCLRIGASHKTYNAISE